MSAARATRWTVLALWAFAAAACAPVYSRTPVPGGGEAAGRSPVERRTAPRGEASREPTPGSADLDASTAALANVLGRLVWPLATDRAAILSSPYGYREHPVSGNRRFHTGIDLRSPEGTPIYAVADGTVLESERSGDYGNVVLIDHGAGLESLYGHASRLLVRAGERVRRGEPIALVGHTGNATGDHLHFELRWDRGTVDPRAVLPLLGGTSQAR